MTEDEIKAIDKRLADMSQRVDAVIAKESRPMPLLKTRTRYQKPDLEELREDYIQRAAQANAWWQAEKDYTEQIFAEFERQFDEMAQAHRQRG